MDYPEANYANFENNCPFTFEMNADARLSKAEKRLWFYDYLS
jgi:hypothetical protein